MGGGVDPILSVRLGVGLLLTSQCPRAPALTSRPRRARGQGSLLVRLGVVVVHSSIAVWVWPYLPDHPAPTRKLSA